ncbi:hypothetical protein P4H61_03980 [Paenibacillus peoriae]|uniref:hypothetical protein n=1 Tax=Paenibacillus peoriae TaxID=59893 RepID=UPI00026C5F3B|nr:hypothetical protein [Paenibacillus peoriae]MEC0180655.1 hypothetical protein [Paenibacillus peoriae]
MTFNKKIKLGISVLAIGAFIASGSLFFTSTNASPNFSEMNTPKISLEASYIDYKTVSELDSNAELIVIGTPLQEFDDRQHIVTSFEDGTIQDFYTLTNIKIDKVIKSPEGTALNVEEPLSIVEPISYIDDAGGKKKIAYEDYTELKQNEKNIIFLKKNTQGQYSVINMDLGKFAIEPSSQSPSSSVDKQDSKEQFRESVLEKYGLK